MARTFRGLLANLSLAFASFLAFFLILEAGIRLYSGVPVFATTNFVIQALDIIRVNSGAMVFDDVLGWRLKDDVGTPGSGFLTSQYGIRTNGIRRSPALPKGAVIAVGDSFTAGSGVRDEETFPAQLEKLVGIPVINGAAGAWSVDQMVLRAEMLAETASPSAVIVGIMVHDTLRNGFDLFGGGYKPWFKLVDGKAILQGIPVRRFEKEPVNLGLRRRIFGHSWLVHWSMTRLGYLDRWVLDAYRYRSVMSEQQAVAVSCGLMSRLRALQDRYGSKVIVLMLWGAVDMELPERRWFGPPVLECARQAGLETLDLYPVLYGLSKADKKRFESLWIDEGGVLGHPSAEGHALTARLLNEHFFSDRRAN